MLVVVGCGTLYIVLGLLGLASTGRQAGRRHQWGGWCGGSFFDCENRGAGVVVKGQRLDSKRGSSRGPAVRSKHNDCFDANRAASRVCQQSDRIVSWNPPRTAGDRRLSRTAMQQVYSNDEVDNGGSQQESRDKTATTQLPKGVNLFLQFADKTFDAEFQSFQKKDINLPLSTIVVLTYFVYFITHYVTFFQSSNPTFIAAFACGILTSFFSFLSMASRYAVAFPAPLFGWTLLKDIHKSLLSLEQSPVYWMSINNGIILSFSTTLVLFMLARVLQGPCDPSFTRWQEQQNCNNGGLGGLPNEEFILSLMAIFLFQTFLKGASLKAIMVAWVITFVVMFSCVYLAGVDVYLLVCFAFLTMLCASYESERRSRRLFMQERSVVEFTRSNAKLVLDLAKSRIDEKQRELDSKGAIVRQISHELRTPLNVVAIGLGIVRQKLETSVPPFVVETLENCEEGCSMALEIISDFLAVEKLAAGMFTLEKVHTELVPYLEKAIKMFHTSADAKSVMITLIPRGGADRTFVADIDPLKMKNVLRNLLSNAVKFSKVGGCVKVTLEYVPSNVSEKQDNDVLITVTDDGAGISPENIQRLFTEGVQFNANALQGGGGSGFGLYIAKGIVTLHGGRIWAESEGEGRGTKFSMLLPASVRSDQSIPTNSVSQPSSVRIKCTGSRDNTMSALSSERKLKVVVVDDSHLNRKLMSQMLTIDGHECLQAEDGLEAIVLMAGQETGEGVDVILIDNNMPRMNGPAAIEEIRRRGFKGVILGISGDAMSTAEFALAGADGTLVKPITREELLSAIALNLAFDVV